jgi:serine protease Do
MKKTLLAIALAGVLILPAACTRTVEVPVDRATGQAAPYSLDRLDPARDPIVQVVERVRPAVVNVSTDSFNPYGGQGGGTGTGFIIRADGVVVTNYHVVEGASQITVITPAPNSREFDARVIGGDASADLAVLKVEGTDLPTVPLGDSADLKLGQRVVAVGYALALKGGPSVTTGIVSALDRVVKADDPNYQTPDGSVGGARTYRSVVQTDAAINPGNSGGPLLNLNGEVIGINTAGTQSAENIGFSIAIDAAKPTIESAMTNPNEPVAYLGVVSQTVSDSLSYQFNLPADHGAYVVDVAPDGPADSAGIQSGDVIVEFDGKKVTGSEQLGELIHAEQPGAKVEIVIARSGGQESVAATLGTNPLP